MTDRYPYTETIQRVLKCFEKHEVTIEHEHGVHRCIHFGRPGSSTYHFRLVTWPGHLAISGDIGDYIFTRTHDMFEFFSSASDRASMPIEINPGYWAEKVPGNYRRGPGSTTHDTRIDVSRAKSHIVEAFREIPRDRFRPGERASAFQFLRGDLLERLHESDSLESVTALIDTYRLYSFHFQDNVEEDQPLLGRYSTSLEWELSEHYPHFTFLACCTAIVWGVKKHAQVKEKRSQADVNRAILKGH